MATRPRPSIALSAVEARPGPREAVLKLFNRIERLCVATGTLVTNPKSELADAPAPDLLLDAQSMVNALRRIDSDHTSFEVATTTAHLWFEEPNDTDPDHGQAA